jgi:hypothetical protein
MTNRLEAPSTRLFHVAFALLISGACGGDKIQPADVLRGVAPFDSLGTVRIPRALRQIASARPASRPAAYIGLQEGLSGFQVYYVDPELRLSSEKIPYNAEVRQISAEKTFPDDSAATAFWTVTSRRIEATLGSRSQCFTDQAVKVLPSRTLVWPIDVHGSVALRQRYRQSTERVELRPMVWISISADQPLRAIQGLQPVEAGRCK